MLTLDDIRIPDAALPKPKPQKSSDGNKKGMGWYIEGPLNGPWISTAARQPGDYTLHVALAILHAKGFVPNNQQIVLERFHFDRFGVLKDSARRALDRLQNAGLIEYVKVGQKFHVTVIPFSLKNGNTGDPPQ